MPWISRIRALLGREKLTRRAEEELEFHLAMREQWNVEHGMPAAEARRDARLRFGNPAVIRERMAAEDVALMLETIVFNIRYAVRQFVRNRGFAVTVILTISLGVGLNTAMFSVIRAVLLEPLGYHDPDRLVSLTNAATPIRFDEMISSAHSYDGLGAYAGTEHLALSGDGRPEVLNGTRISGNFLNILGVQPLRGRGFLPSEDKPGAPAVAMISAELWQRRFGGAPSIVGRQVTLAGESYSIVGVLPPKFQFPSAATDVWLTKPSEWPVLDPQSRRISPFLHIFGRLKSGIDISQANAELIVIDHQYDASHPGMLDTNRSIARRWNRPPTHLELMKDQLVSDISSKLWLLFGAVGLVLLIVCANTASLLLARTTARSHEFTVRAAIGANRSQIAAQLLTESILLSFVGGAFGVALAEFTVRLIRGVTLLNLPRSGEIRIDGTVLLFAVILSLLTGLLFGLAPALASSRPDLAGLLRGSGEGSGSASQKTSAFHFNPRSLLVVAQVALSTILLIGSALLIKSLAQVYRVDPGFQVSNLLTMRLTLSPARYDTEQKRAAFYDALIEHIDALAGVSSCAVTSALPMTGTPLAPVQIAGRAQTKVIERPLAVIENITPKYFQTMKIPLEQGREFTEDDTAGSVPAGIINDSMARRFWPQYPGGSNPIGQRILIGSHLPPTEIVGIVADIRQQQLTELSLPEVYLAAAQQPPESAMLAIRTKGEPLSLVSAVGNQILTLDRDQPVSKVLSMSEVVDDSQGQLRVMMTLLAIFAAVATIIAVIGLYGVISYSVVQRTKEIGIRRALGAKSCNILALVVGHGLRLVLGGLVLGLCGAFALTRLLQGLMFHVSNTDPSTYIEITFLFVIVALAASFFPARRAADIDPLITLRAS